MPTLQRAPEVDGRILEVDWDHPAADGLVGVWVAGCSVNVANGKEPKFRALGRGRPSGLSGRFAGTVSTDSRVVGVGSNWGFATAFTTGTSNLVSAVTGVNAASGSGEGFGFHATHSNATYAGAIYAGSSYSVIGKPTGGALSNNTRYVIGASRAGSNGKVYRNGILTASAGSLSAPPACAVLTLGNHSNGTGGWSVAPDFEYFLLWSKAPSPAVFLEVAREWRRLLRKNSVWLPAASGGTTVAPSKGALTFTGKQPSIAQTANQTIAPAKGALVLTGKQPTVSQGANQTVAPSKGAITFTGKQPTVTQTANQTVAPSKGALTFTGKQPTVSQDSGTVVAPSKGTLTFQGGIPSITQTANQIIVPSKGSLVFVGKTPTVEQSGAVTFTRAPGGGGYPATVPTTERYGMSNTTRPAMTNTRR